MGGHGCATACTDAGGSDGVGVEIPRVLFVKTGSVRFVVCDENGCATATARLGPVPEGPVGRGSGVSFDALGRDFEPGDVDVTVTLSDAEGDVVAEAQRPVELARDYPNGELCDGDGFINGSITLTRGDRV